MSLPQGLRDNSSIRENRHKMTISLPAGNDMKVNMIYYPGPGYLSQIHSHIKTLRMQNLLKEVLHPEGFNVGMNLGKVAGAGIVDHVHLHIVPRWKGDSHFMSVLSNTRIISEALRQTHRQLKDKLNKLSP